MLTILNLMETVKLQRHNPKSGKTVPSTARYRCVITVLIICNQILTEMYLFVVCWSQGQIIQAVWGHIPNTIKEPRIGYSLHT